MEQDTFITTFPGRNDTGTHVNRRRAHSHTHVVSAAGNKPDKSPIYTPVIMRHAGLEHTTSLHSKTRADPVTDLLKCVVNKSSPRCVTLR